MVRKENEIKSVPTVMETEDIVVQLNEELEESSCDAVHQQEEKGKRYGETVIGETESTEEETTVTTENATGDENHPPLKENQQQQEHSQEDKKTRKSRKVPSSQPSPGPGGRVTRTPQADGR